MNYRVTICIATYNGEKYIREQLESILKQLGMQDEIIVSDDSSTDATLNIVRSFNDSRIKIYSQNKFHSPIFNFENALKKAKGDYIFLCDQDDVWEQDKISTTLSYLDKYCLVVSDCRIIDGDGFVVRESFWDSHIPKVGVLNNLIKNHYLGCCMAFRRELLKIALPFPPRIAMHDIWLGLCASFFFSTIFIPDNLMRYRRHGGNVSPTAEHSTFPLTYSINYRLYFLYQLMKRRFQCKKFLL